MFHSLIVFSQETDISTTLGSKHIVGEYNETEWIVSSFIEIDYSSYFPVDVPGLQGYETKGKVKWYFNTQWGYSNNLTEDGLALYRT